MPLSFYAEQKALDALRKLVMTVVRVKLVACSWDDTVLGFKEFKAKPGEQVKWTPPYKTLSRVDAICYDGENREIYRNHFPMIWPQDLTYSPALDMQVQFEGFNPELRIVKL
jgi:hypothetical protein